MFKAFFILEIYKFLPWLSGFVEKVQKWLDNKAMVNFKIYDATHWT